MTRNRLFVAAVLAVLAVIAPGLSAAAPHAQEPVSTSAEPEPPMEAIPPSLTPRDVRQLREGRGMGMGRVAGINGYPGPMHVLRQAEDLGLSEDQVAASESLRSRVHERSREIGERVEVYGNMSVNTGCRTCDIGILPEDYSANVGLTVRF